MNIPDRIEMPAATAWPVVLEFGLSLVLAGFVTAGSVSILRRDIGRSRRCGLVPPGPARGIPRVGASSSGRNRC